jgi:hypothetical protein
MISSQFPHDRPFARLTRREMLRRCSMSFGSLALSALLSEKVFGAVAPQGVGRGPHLARPTARAGVPPDRP